MSEQALQIRSLQAGYGKRVVLEDIALTLAAGEWYVLLGPNGSGKSTLLDCVVGRLRPTRGEIAIAGYSLGGAPFEAKRRLGYGCAPETLPKLLKARQCLEVHAAAKQLTAVDDELLALAAELKFTPYLDEFVDTLSLGTRQKLSILLAFIGAPSLIVLDEAFNGLDPASAWVVKRHLRTRLERGAALLLATHALDIVEHHADRAGVLIDGRLQREWQKAEIADMRRNGQDFETSLAQTLAT
jgi:ABC-2 type transport system ATP-binding protein